MWNQMYTALAERDKIIEALKVCKSPNKLRYDQKGGR